jgi:hypothetical protein
VQLLFLDRYAALADADGDAGRLFAVLIDLVAENRRGDSKHADNQEKNISVHRLAACMRAKAAPRSLSKKNPGRCWPAGVNDRTLASMGGIEGARW